MNFIDFLYRPYIKTEGENNFTQEILSKYGLVNYKNEKDYIFLNNIDINFFTKINNFEDKTLPEVLTLYEYAFKNKAEQTKNLSRLEEYLYNNIKNHEITDFKMDKILICSPFLNRTGSGLILLDLIDKLKIFTNHVYIYTPNSDINTIIKESESVHLIKNKEELRAFEYVIINTLHHSVVDLINEFKWKNCVLWIHETSDHYYDINFNIDCKLIITDSYRINDLVSKCENLNKNYIQTVYPANNFKTDINSFDRHSLRKKYNIDEDALVFLNLGQPAAIKNQVMFLKAYLDVCPNHEHLKKSKILLVEGNQDVLKLLEDNKKMEENVIFVPEVPFDSLGEYYALSDYYFNTTLDEPFGRVLIESMEFKKPVISYKSMSAQEIVINDFNGFLFEDINELKNILVSLPLPQAQASNITYNNLCENAYIYYKYKFESIERFQYEMIQLLRFAFLNDKIIFNYKILDENKIFNKLEAFSFVNNGNIYIHGGYSGNSTIVNTQLIEYNLKNKTIKNVSEIPDLCAKNHFMPHLKDNMFYIFSGQREKNYGKSSNKIFTLNIDTKEYTEITNIKDSFYCSANYELNNKLLLYAGIDKTRTVNSQDIYEFSFGDKTFNKLEKKHNLVIGHSCSVQVNDKLYIISGCSCHSYVNRDEEFSLYLNICYYHHAIMYVIDIKSNEILTKKIPFKVSHTSVFYKDDKLFILGGSISYDRPCKKIYIYDIKLDTWVQSVLDYEFCLKGSNIIKHDDKYLVLSGHESENGEFVGRFNEKLFEVEIIS